MATITIPKILANFETTLASKVTSAASSLTIDRSTDGDGTTLSGLYSVTFDEGTSLEEHMYVTFAGAAGTVSRRGLSKVDAWTEVSGNKFEHDRGASVKITNVSQILLQRLLNGDDSFNSVAWTGVASISGLSTPTAGETTKAANVAYVNAVSVAGASDATTSTKGIVELATQAEYDARTATGGSGASLVATPALVRSVLVHDYAADAGGTDAYAITLTPAPTAYTTGARFTFKANTANTGAATLNVNALGAKTIVKNKDTALADSDIKAGQIVEVVYDGTNMQMVSPTNMDEAQTFFGSTDITGAEAETLTLGTTSDASASHYHDEYENLKSQVVAGKYLFVGGFGDGLTATVTGTALIQRTHFTTTLFGTTSGDDAFLTTALATYQEHETGDRDPEWDDTGTVSMFLPVSFSGSVTQDFFFGLYDGTVPAASPADATLTTRHAAWMVDDGTLYYSVADGTTQNRASTACTLTNNNILEIVYTQGVSVVFKLNGTTVATVTTNLPTGTSTNGAYAHIMYTTLSANDQTAIIRHPFVFKKTA